MQKEKLEDEKMQLMWFIAYCCLGCLFASGFAQSEKHSFTTSSSINWDMVVGAVLGCISIVLGEK